MAPIAHIDKLLNDVTPYAFTFLLSFFLILKPSLKLIGVGKGVFWHSNVVPHFSLPS